jgi:hypothetical protein
MPKDPIYITSIKVDIDLTTLSKAGKAHAYATLLQVWWEITSALTKLPPITAVHTRDKGGHGFIGTPRLHLIITALALLALATLEHVCLSFRCSDAPCIHQALFTHLSILLFLFLTLHILHTINTEPDKYSIAHPAKGVG